MLSPRSWASRCAESAGDPTFRRQLARLMVGGVVTSFVAGMGLAWLSEHYRIGIDMQKQHCLPWTVYLLSLGNPPSVKRGQVVAFTPRGGIMGPRFDGQLVAKMVGGVAGDVMEVKQDVVYINGARFGVLDLTAKLGKAPGGFDRTVIVPPGHVLLMGTEPRSLDGRYWGTFPMSQLVGSVTPIY